jgi:hypothetical protein
MKSRRPWIAIVAVMVALTHCSFSGNVVRLIKDGDPPVFKESKFNASIETKNVGGEMMNGNFMKPTSGRVIRFSIEGRELALSRTTIEKGTINTREFGLIRLLFSPDGSYIVLLSLDQLNHLGRFLDTTPLSIDWIRVDGGPRGDFYLSATEVTFDQYDLFCKDQACFSPPADFGRGQQPVIYVSVSDAVAFCEWLSKKTGEVIRLPEEDEWEFAAKGGRNDRSYEYSGSKNISDVAWFDENSQGQAHLVGTLKPNEIGAYDMCGNVWEWCGTKGAVRGGAWDSSHGNCRWSARDVFSDWSRLSNLGFRVMRQK